MIPEINLDKFPQFLIDNSVVGIKPEGITLKSKKISHWYANCRVLSGELQLLEKTANYVVELIDKLNIDVGEGVLGIPEGATLLGQKIQEKLIQREQVENNIYMFRSKSKEHGDVANKYWVTGKFPKSTLLVEDVTTTLTSALQIINRLNDMDIEIKGLVGLLNREQLNENGNTVVETLEKIGIPYFSLSNAAQVLPQITTDDHMRRIIQNEYDKEYLEFNRKAPILF